MPSPTYPIFRRTAACVAIVLVITAKLPAWQAADGSKSQTRTASTNSTAPDSTRAHPWRNVGVEEFARLRDARTNVVLDVRTAKEFQTGHIPGSVNLDFHSPDFKEKLQSLDKTKGYLVHCAAGARSAKACAVMSTIEFKNVVNLEGGFKAWEAQGKPVEH